MGSDSNIDKVAAAARNNAAWHEVMFRAHDLPDEISPSVWLSRAARPSIGFGEISSSLPGLA